MSHTDKLDRLRAYGAATVHEAVGRLGAIDPAIKPLDPTTTLVGTAFTVDCAPADNLAVQRAVDLADPGDVLVIDAKGYLDAGLWGDLLTRYAQHRGVAGIVVDGAVRDSRDIIGMRFPVFTRGLCIKGTDKLNPGRINVPLVFGGVRIEPGDIVIGDADGLTVVPAGDVDTALAAAAQRQAKEDRLRVAIDAGESLLDLMGLREHAPTH
ncbi:MAG TPA: 4-carboxy-4-hydroxy-2-oxoadipate aldolase/oxaloacetate decarboxylase [Aldersonia sp.]